MNDNMVVMGSVSSEPLRVIYSRCTVKLLFKVGKSAYELGVNKLKLLLQQIQALGDRKSFILSWCSRDKDFFLQFRILHINSNGVFSFIIVHTKTIY